MSPLELCFWLSAAVIGYVYILYPLLLAVLARLRRSGLRSSNPCPRSVSVIVAAHNEEAAIGKRLDELTALIRESGVDGEVIVVSDGSTDTTALVARRHTQGPVHVLELPTRGGKAAALSAGAAIATHEILVLSDTRQSWAPGALKLLLENFRDPAVGAVSGDLVVERAPGVLAGVGLYWRYEKWLRKLESQVFSTVGVTGAISAVRRELFPPIPSGTILDDVYWPLRVAMQGFRVVHDARACAYDRLPERAWDEFLRKIRTLSGNYQLLTRLPTALLPWRNPVWFQFVSHKLLRLVVPWALLLMLGTASLLPGPWYRLAFGAQVTFHTLGVLGLWHVSKTRLRLASAAGSFLILNAAAWLAFWVWVSGRSGTSWRKISYRTAPANAPVVPVTPPPALAIPKAVSEEYVHPVYIER